MVHKTKNKPIGELSNVVLVITRTSKSYDPKAKWMIYDQESKTFPSMKEAKAWIKDQYGKSKRQPMYVDDKSGKSHKIGYIIGMRSSQYNRETGKDDNYMEQHWIEFRQQSPLSLNR